jgi:DNA-binding transcriptional LysR family regulator
MPPTAQPSFCHQIRDLKHMVGALLPIRSLRGITLPGETECSS